MKGRKVLTLLLVIMLISSIFAGCAKEPEGNAPADPKQSSSGEQAQKATVKGEITFLTHRTDVVDTLFQDYLKKFNEKYPDVKVKFEAITDYEGQVKIRLNTKDYGDVLGIPNIDVNELPNFFVELGTVQDLGKKYRFIDKKALGDKVYGIPHAGTAQGIVYNKKVFEKADITQLPKTPDEFIAALKQIKEKTDAIPLYTNYAAGWALDQWEANRTGVAGDPNYVNSLAHTDSPFTKGTPHYIVYKLMYDVVKEGLVEKDPFTSDWESSKPMIAEGKIATMVLGSWAIGQMQSFAENPDDIGYMPFPYTAKDGKMYSGAAADYCFGINKNSKNIEAAKAWMYWFIDESGFAQSQGMIPTGVDQPFPESLRAFQDMGVVLLEDAPAPLEEAGWVDAIDNKAEVGLWKPDFKKRIVEAALGNRKESFDDIMNDLNKRWADARKEVVN